MRVTRSDTGLRWSIRGVGHFAVSRTGAEVRYDLEAGCDPRDAEQALIGPVLGTALQLRGASLLHASGLVVGDRAIAISAPSGYGKSTLAAALLRRGSRLLSDDTVPLAPLGDACLALPYLPRLKLWPESLDAFGASAGGYERVISWAAKRTVAVDGAWGTSSAEACPLAAIYLLAPGRDARAPEISALQPAEAVLNLQAALYQSDLLDPQQAAATLQAMTEVAERVPVRRVRYQRHFDALDGVCTALLDDVAMLAADRAASERRA